MRNCILLATVLLFLGSTTAHARTVYFGSEIEPVTVLYGEETVFRFPTEVMSITKAGRFVIEPVNSEQPDYRYLKVKPRFTKGKADVSFILSDGQVIKTRLQVVRKSIPEKTDSVYDFKSKASLITENREGSNAPKISELELMKAMIRGDKVSGYNIKHFGSSVKTGFKGVSGKLRAIYTGNEFNGYVYKLSNITKKHTYMVRLPNLTFGNPNVALLGQVDHAVLGPVGSGKSITYLRIVAKPSSVSKSVTLPIAYVPKKKGESDGN